MVKPKPHYRQYYSSSVDKTPFPPPLPRSPSPLSANTTMPLGPRIFRLVILVGLVVLLVVIVHTAILYPRGQCLASLDMGQEPIDVDQLQVDLKEKVDLYYYPFDDCRADL